MSYFKRSFTYRFLPIVRSSYRIFMPILDLESKNKLKAPRYLRKLNMFILAPPKLCRTTFMFEDSLEHDFSA